jgi:UDPglucose 6-dehydrogenase
MRVTIFGSGYVGLVTGACLADVGNDVLCVDVDADKIGRLQQGEVPIFEPGLTELVVANASAGRLEFSTDLAKGVEHGDVLFVAVGTPPDASGGADLSYVLSVAASIGQHIKSFKVVATKSTVPVGTADRVEAAIAQALDGRSVEFAVVSNPEFLKEGAAIGDFNRPDRIIIGIDEAGPAGPRALRLMQALYQPFNLNRDRTLVMDVRSAELTKYAANAMLATRISFMNELANLAEDLGADIELVRRGIGSDPRIGYSFLYAGTGYGGSCFPKDVRALRQTGLEHGHQLSVLAAVEAANQAQKSVLARKVVAHYGADLSGKRFGLWGLAFKPNTDDMREAPSRTLIADLIARGARISAFDPVANAEAERHLRADLGPQASRIAFAGSARDAAAGADALLIVTEWKAFRSPDFRWLAETLKDRAIFDGRNMYEPAFVREAGLRYFPVGRAARGA